MINFTWPALLPMTPEIVLAVGALFLLVIGVMRRSASLTPILIGAALLLIVAGGLTATAGNVNAFLLNGFFVQDAFSIMAKMLIIGAMIAVLALSADFLKREGMARFEYPILLLFITLGMMLMVSAHNLLSLYIALELQSLSIYILAAFRRDDGRSSEAGLKYFILGSLSSGMLLFGISFIYGYTGAIDYDAIRHALPIGQNGAVLLPDAGLTVGLVFVLVGIAFKISAVPFHMWTPDVYEGAPTSVTTLMALAPKLAALALMTRLLYGPFMLLLPQWQQIVWFLSVASMVWGAFAAIGQVNIKRLLAYSSINNMGYAMIGIAAGTAHGVSSMLIYMAIYMVMTAGVFGIVITLRRGGKSVEAMADLAGLSRTNPRLAYAMAFFMFSVAGIPPLSGFFGKLVVFQAAIAAGMPVLAVIGVVASVVAAYYYLRIIKIMFFDEAAAPLDREINWLPRLAIGLSVAFTLLFIFMPNSLVEAGRDAATAFFAG